MLSEAEIKRFIDEDAASEKKRQAAIGQRYYEAEHDILDMRLFFYNADGVLTEDKTRSNVKISHPFFTELSDQLVSYVLSFKDNPVRANEGVEGLQKQLDTYFDEQFWDEMAELVGGAYNKGFDYMYAYKNEEDRIAFQYADGTGVIEVRAKDTDDNCEYVIYWYIDRIDKGQKLIKRIQVWDDKQVYYFVQVDNGEVKKDDGEKINPKPHTLYKSEDKEEITYENFGFIPFWRLDNNRKQISGLKPVKAIIDDYDIHACSLSNNLIDFDTPLHVVRGFNGDNLDELQQNIKTKKMIGVDEGGGVEVHTVDIPYQARQQKLTLDEVDIYRFGMGFNSSQAGDGNITNVVIRSRYALLDLKGGRMKSRIKRFLKQLLKVVIAEINDKEGTDYQVSDVYFDFTSEITTNETENIQNDLTKAQTQQVKMTTIMNVAAVVGDEQVLKAICEQLDWDYQEIKIQVEKLKAEAAEQQLAAAKAALEGAVADDEPIPAGAEPLDNPGGQLAI